MNILILSKDPTFFCSALSPVIGDTLSRHIFYAKKLNDKYPNAKIIIITYTKKFKNQQIKKLQYLGLEIIATNSKFRATFIIGAIIEVFRLYKKKWKPNIITVQTPWEEGVLGWLSARIFGAAFITQLHFDLFSKNWLKESYLNPYRKLIASITLKRSNRIRVVSKALQIKVSTQFNINKNKIDVVPVGVDFKPVEMDKQTAKKKMWPQYEDKILILFVGRLCESKNLELMMEVAKKICSINDSTVFVIVGDGEKLQRLKCVAHQFNIADKVIFTGVKKHSELPIIYKAADLFLLTSSHEGFGRVVLESQMSSLPVISTKCGGPEELILDGQTGLLVNIGSVDEICNAIDKLISNKELYKNISISAFEASKNYSIDILTENIINSWESSLNNENKINFNNSNINSK